MNEMFWERWMEGSILAIQTEFSLRFQSTESQRERTRQYNICNRDVCSHIMSKSRTCHAEEERPKKKIIFNDGFTFEITLNCFISM